MSADNTIAILESKDGYRVAHIQAVEEIQINPDYPVDNPQYNKERLQLLFGEAIVYSTMLEAHRAAFKLYKDFGYVEYGVCSFELDTEFPT